MTGDEKTVQYLDTLTKILHNPLLYSMEDIDANTIADMYVYFSNKHKKDSQKTLVKRGKENGR